MQQNRQTLSMPKQPLLFNYTFNTEGLQIFMEKVKQEQNRTNIRLNELEKCIVLKLERQDLTSSQKIIELKINNVNDSVVQLNAKLQELREKCLADDRRIDSKINQSFRRIQERVELSNNSLTNTINQYFAQNNKNLSNTQTELTNFITTSLQNIKSVKDQINSKVSQKELGLAIAASQLVIKKQLASMLSTDQMKRMATLNEYSTKLKQNQKEVQLQLKYLKQTIDELTLKVNKSVQNNAYEVQKHKIYEKLSQFRSSIESLMKKNQQFVDFRKDALSINQKNRQNFIGIQEQIVKIKQKSGKFSKLENIGSVIQSLDPHLICQVGNTVNLHQKSIDKLEKMILELQKDLNLKVGQNIPQVNNGQSTDLMIKMVKQYMSNLDFDGRVKKTQKQIHDLIKKNDLINELDKKVQIMLKQMDIQFIMKQIKKKSDQQNTMKDFRILDSKVEKIYQFYKTLRKQLEDYIRKSSKVVKDRHDNASLTTKKLYPSNCISCEPSPISKTQRLFYPRNKANISFDQSIDFLHPTSYIKSKK